MLLVAAIKPGRSETPQEVALLPIDLLYLLTYENRQSIYKLEKWGKMERWFMVSLSHWKD
jgi:hypothetical protein